MIFRSPPPRNFSELRIRSELSEISQGNEAIVNTRGFITANRAVRVCQLNLTEKGSECTLLRLSRVQNVVDELFAQLQFLRDCLVSAQVLGLEIIQ